MLEELPIKLRWSAAGQLAARAEACRGNVTKPGASISSPLGSSASAAGASVNSLSLASSGRGAPFDLSTTIARIDAVWQWCASQRASGGTIVEVAMIRLNATQLEARASITRDEAAARMKMLATGGRTLEGMKVLLKFCEDETHKRQIIMAEAKDFIDFAISKEPQWRRLAANKELAREYADNAMVAMRVTYEEEFAKWRDQMFAVSLQEREDRDMAFARQYQREEQDASMALARKYEQERLQQEREAELRRVQAIQQRQQQQQQMNGQYGRPPQQQQFAMPPSNLYPGTAYGAGYSYNYGPSAGTYTGSNGTYPNNTRR